MNVTDTQWHDAMAAAVALSRAVLHDRDDDMLAILNGTDPALLAAALVRMVNATGTDLHGSPSNWDAHLAQVQDDLTKIGGRL